MLRKTLLLTALLLSTITASARALKGAVLQSGSSGLYLTNIETGEEQHLVTVNVGHSMFSPDGRKIAYLKGSDLMVMKNDGTDGATLTTGISAVYGEISWTENGFFWLDGFVLKRYDPQTDTKTNLVTLQGDKSQGLWMSRDGHRGLAWVTDSNYDDPRLEFNADFTDVTITRWHHISHGQIISSDGNYAIFNDFGDVFNNPDYLGHKSLVIQEFGETTPPNGLVGFVNIPDMGDAMPNHKPLATCINNADYVLCNSKVPETWVVNWRTGEYWQVSRPRPDIMYLQLVPSCMWYGDLPSPDATTPEIALSTSTVAFDTDGSEVVDVTNVGVGDLTAVTVDVSPASAWLTVTPGGSGNAQTLTNTATAGSLANGVYDATVTVSGGGASNTVSYTVTLTVGSVLSAPDSLQADVIIDTLLDVQLSWVDNNTTEAGYVVYRMGTDTQQVATLPADASSFLDEGVDPATYTYRVVALDDGGTEGTPADLRLDVDGPPAVYVTSPGTSASVNVGDTLYISWVTRHVTTVEIRYSIDEGETWTAITAQGGVGTGQAEWANYPWAVPDLSAGSALIMVLDYGTPEVSGLSPLFSIVGGSGVAGSPLHHSPPETGLSVRAGNGQVHINYAGQTRSGLRVDVYGLDGSRRAAYCTTQQTGQFTWQASGSGVYMIRTRTGRDARNVVVPAVR